MDKNKLYPWYFAIGALVLYLILYIVPGIMGIGYSFTDWNSYTSEVNFIGLDNFIKIFSGQSNYYKYLGNTIWFTLVTTLLKTGLGLALALLLTQKVKGLNFHRAIMFMPSILSLLIIGIVFKSIMNPATGMLNTFLRAIGLDKLAQQWLVNPDIAFNSIMAVDIWRGTGYIMTIIIVGILSISPTYYEAASIDGASAFAKFKAITLPLIMPTLTVTIVLNVLYGLKVFDMVYVLTNGGPGYVTEVMYTSVFKEFSTGRYGMGTALSSVMFVIMVIVGYFLIKTLTKEEVVE